MSNEKFIQDDYKQSEISGTEADSEELMEADNDSAQDEIIVEGEVSEVIEEIIRPSVNKSADITEKRAMFYDSPIAFELQYIIEITEDKTALSSLAQTIALMTNDRDGRKAELSVEDARVLLQQINLKLHPKL
jgi:hypothetical protein